MATEIKVPSAGESVKEGTLARWFKEDGAAVHADEPLLELETDKATMEVPSPATGTLRIQVREGQTVSVGTVVGRVEDGAAAANPGPAPKPDDRAAQPSRKAVDGVAAPLSEPAAKAGAEVALSPAARRLAADESVDVRQLAAGRSGPITKEDVASFLEKRTADKKQEPAPASPPPSAVPPRPSQEARETRQRMSSIRQRIAQRLVEAQTTAAILTTFNEADLSAVLDLRSRYRELFQKKHGVGLGLMSFFVKACVEALRAFPVVNARIDGSETVYHNYHNIGVAVSTDKGLMVPVLRDASQLSFAEIEKRLAELAQKARDGKINVADLQGGTFTITNGGVFGSLLSTPILNPPQSGILGMHTIQKRPVAVNDQVVIRPMMYLALAYDHRLIDGREAVQFLVHVKECIESPERLLLEV
jgi:2-oxoglutarate dehydrogenase E2 component (dihydrolipoamide succinyltransferase)